MTASYSGDINDNGNVSTALTQAMHAIATTTSLGTGATAGPAPQTVLIATVIGTSGPIPTGTVTFTNGTTVIGTATLDSTGVGTLLPDLAPSSYNLVANYSGDSLHSSSSSSAVKVSGIPIGFGITVNPATITMASSQNSVVTVTVESNNGFADTIGFGCGTLPAGVTCHFANGSVPLKAGASQTVQLTIDTNSPLGGGSTAMNSGRGRKRFSLAGLFLPAGLLFGWVGWKFRKRNGILFAAILALFLVRHADGDGMRSILLTDERAPRHLHDSDYGGRLEQQHHALSEHHPDHHEVSVPNLAWNQRLFGPLIPHKN